MSETPLQVAAEMLDDARQDMVNRADLLHSRLGKLIEEGKPGRGYDLPTIVNMLTVLRDAIEMYRRAEAVLGAQREAASQGES